MQPLQVLRSYREAPREEDMGCYLSQQEGIWPQGLDIVLIKSYKVQLLSHIRLFVTPWTAARQASLSFTISQSLLKLMSIELVMLSSQFILCHPLHLLPSTFPSFRVFSSESDLHIKWPKCW